MRKPNGKFHLKIKIARYSNVLKFRVSSSQSIRFGFHLSMLINIFYAEIQIKFFTFFIYLSMTPQIYIRNALAIKSKRSNAMLKSGFLLESKIPKGITINIKSATFINSIIAVAEEDLKEKFPLNIKGSQAFITKYERWLQTYSQTNIHRQKYV